MRLSAPTKEHVSDHTDQIINITNVEANVSEVTFCCQPCDNSLPMCVQQNRPQLFFELAICLLLALSELFPARQDLVGGFVDSWRVGDAAFHVFLVHTETIPDSAKIHFLRNEFRGPQNQVCKVKKKIVSMKFLVFSLVGLKEDFRVFTASR